MDVWVLNAPLDGPRRSFASVDGNASPRSLFWSDIKLPVAWCGTESGRVLVVRSPVGHTQDGDVTCEIVVNATGYRVNEVGAMLGVEHPVAGRARRLR